MGDEKNENLKFKDQEFISNRKFFDMFMKLDSTVDEILQTLNNGLKSTVDSNSKDIETMKDKLDNLEDTIDKRITADESKKESRAHTREIIAYIVAIAANLGWIMTMLDVF